MEREQSHQNSPETAAAVEGLSSDCSASNSQRPLVPPPASSSTAATLDTLTSIDDKVVVKNFQYPTSQQQLTNFPVQETQRREEIAKARQLKKLQRAQLLEEKQQRRFQQLQQKNGWSDVSSWKNFQESCSIRQQQQEQQQQQHEMPSSQVEATVAGKPETESVLGEQFQDSCNDTMNIIPLPEEQPSSKLSSESKQRVLRIAVVGSGGWFANRAHLPALAKLIQRHQRHQGDQATAKYEITVLCGSHPERALQTLARHGIQRTAKNMMTPRSSTTNADRNGRHVYTFSTLDAYLDYEGEQQIQRQQSSATIDHKSSQRHSSRVHSLADVCLLCLPTTCMVQAIGRCLRANK